MIPTRMTQTRYTRFSVVLTLCVSLHAIALSAEEQKQSSQQHALSAYWLNQSQLDLLPEPKPSLSPQCDGVFFQQTNTDPEFDQSSNNNSAEPEQQTITADKALYKADGTSTFEGNVLVHRGNQTISSDYLRYHHEKNTLDLQGKVQIENQGLLISSDSASYDNNEGSATLGDAEFLMFENGLNGHAKSIYISKVKTDVRHSAITSCPPGKENWLLKSSDLHLDQDKGWGYAKNASLSIAKVPILYTPYFTFPLDDRRKSGFLYPSLGSDSLNGTDIALPYYINIAPNYDATLTPRLLSKRGTQLAGEFRYLNTLGEGALSGDYLGQDDINPNFSERKQAQWHHQLSFLDSWHFDADYFYVSDSDYFDDLDSFSGTTSLGYLERNGSLSYLAGNAYFSVLAQDYQVLDSIADIDQPYRLAPQVNAGYSYNTHRLPLTLSLDSQVTQFERDLNATAIGAAAVSAGELTTGSRLVLQPEIAGELSSSAYFIRPAAKLHYRQYQLNDYQALNQDKELEQSVEIYSLDSGLIFERKLQAFDQSLTQTLEPRLKLVKIPFQDQSQDPNFDSALLSLNSEQLFRERRYSGDDLVGDTEQATIGLSSRFYDEQQIQRAKLTLGQIVYFQDRRIQLDTSEDPLAKQSPLLASAQISLFPFWKFNQSVQWDSENNALEQFNSGIQFKNDMSQIVNLEFRYRPSTATSSQKETQASFVWPLSNHWKGMSFWNFDLNQHSTIELASGLEYENCCIIFRMMNQKWLRKISSTASYESANKQSLEIQLKGLGSLNNQISDYLKNKIPGFEG